MKLKLVEKRPEASDTISFIFQPDTPFNWQPGQFLQYSLIHSTPDDRGEKRFFTIAAAPFEQHVMVTTRFTPEKGSSFKKNLKELTIGSEIEASGPNGSFTLDDPQKQHVFMAGGIGITPFRSMLLELGRQQKPLNVTLLYANRNNEIIFRDELEDVAKRHPELKIHYILDPQKIDIPAIKSLVPDLKTPIFYLSGPKPFVDGMKTNLEQLGVVQEQIKTDYFPGYLS